MPGFHRELDDLPVTIACKSLCHIKVNCLNFISSSVLKDIAK